MVFGDKLAGFGGAGIVIYTSDLPNDQDMIRALGSMAIPVSLFTDACFSSVDSKVIACERKKIGDICSCINDGRFLFQMQNCKSAGADYLCLILEGRSRRSPGDGLLEIPVWKMNGNGKRAEVWEPVKPTMTHTRFSQFLWELPFLAGIFVLRSENVRGTADLILSLYDWFQRPEHHSLEQIYKAPTPTVQLVRPSLVRRVASELPGVGWQRSGVVAEHFPTVRAMVDADWKEWSSLSGIGKKTARKVVESLGGESGGDKGK